MLFCPLQTPPAPFLTNPAPLRPGVNVTSMVTSTRSCVHQSTQLSTTVLGAAGRPTGLASCAAQSVGRTIGGARTALRRTSGAGLADARPCRVPRRPHKQCERQRRSLQTLQGPLMEIGPPWLRREKVHFEREPWIPMQKCGGILNRWRMATTQLLAKRMCTICMHVYIYICVCTCLHVHLPTCTYSHVYSCTFVHV